jgi:exopolysaccharide production protein ExoZ
LGDASYSLYLTHVITIAAVAAIWTRQLSFLPPVLFIAVSLAASIAVAMLCFRLVERPLTHGLKRLSVSAPVPAALEQR